jgi:hypothetical protein
MAVRTARSFPPAFAPFLTRPVAPLGTARSTKVAATTATATAAWHFTTAVSRSHFASSFDS